MGDGDVRYFDLFARLYDAVMPSADRGRFATALDRANREVLRVVDVGGGTGRAVAVVDAPVRIVVDASSAMLSRVPRPVAAVNGTATRLPLSDESVDAVLIVDALHHLPDQDAAIRQAARVLAPGGVLVIRDFDRSNPGGRLLELGEHAIGMQSAFRTVPELADAVGGADLEPIVVDRGVTCTVVGRKPGEP